MTDLNITENDIKEFKKFIDKEGQRINKSGIDRFDFENLYTFPGEKTDFNFYKSVADSLFDLRDEEINNAFWQSYGIGVQQRIGEESSLYFKTVKN